MTVRIAGWLLAAATIGSTAAAVVLNAGLEHERAELPAVVAGAAAFVLVAGLGLLIVERSAGGRIGLLLLGFVTILSVSNAADRITAEVILDGGRDPWWARMLVYGSQGTWPLMFGTIVTLAVIFPTGRPLTGRWRRVLAVAAVAWGVLTVTLWCSPEDAFEPYDGLQPPIGAPGWIAWPLFVVTWALTAASLPTAVVAIVVRYRRSVGLERKQLAWLVYAVGLAPVAILTFVLSWIWPDETGALSSVAFGAFALGIPLAVTVALTRYRLYDIDWIVNRTLVYAAVTAVLAAAWVGVALGLGVLAGGRSPWIVAAATGAVAVVFSPLRRRVQSAVDRRFARARFEAVRRLRDFEERVRDGRARPEDVVGVLREALGDPSAELALRPGERGTPVDLDGRGVDVDGRAATPVVRDGGEIAVLVHDLELAHRPHLVRPVLAAASLTIELARLQVELRRQLVEVERSRERIVRAGDEERRRLERDLHDGAQQRLVGLGIRLRRIQRSLPAAARVLGPALDEAVDEVGKAIADLRTIASGLRPSSLDDGLAAALAELARSTPVPIDVAATRERLPEPIEAAAYFVVCEAVTNAVKHGSPSAIRIDAVRDSDAIRLTVADDGVGGAVARAGSGLAGLADRLGAHGGTLTVDSPPGTGTRVEAVIPCAT